MKQMNDEVEIVQQHPAPLRQTFCVMHRRTVLPKSFLDMFAERAHMGVGRTARDDEVVRHVRDAFEAQDDDVIRLVVQQNRGGALRELGDRRRLLFRPAQ